MDCIAITQNGTQCGRHLKESDIKEGYTECWQHRDMEKNNLFLNTFFSINPQKGVGSILTNYLTDKDIDILTNIDPEIKRYEEFIPYKDVIKFNRIEDYLELPVKEQKRFKSIEIRGSGIPEYKAKALAEIFKFNNYLTSLNLSNNFMSEEGVKYLADALRVNTSVTSLNLDDNFIGDNGATYLAEALEVNSSLKNLSLRNNRILKNGAIALVDALKYNNSLTHLDLYYNEIGEDGINAIKDVRKVNKRVRIYYQSQ